MIRVLLVDDHPVVRQGLRAMLGGAAEIEVVGEASSGQEAEEKAIELKPEVILMDIRMPDIGGIEATRRIKRAYPTVSVIMLTIYDSDMHVIEAVRAGAAGYLTKDCSRELLCHAIQAVADGGTLVRSGLMRAAIHGLRMPKDRTEGVGADVQLHDRLTPREMECLRCWPRGMETKRSAPSSSWLR